MSAPKEDETPGPYAGALAMLRRRREAITDVNGMESIPDLTETLRFLGERIDTTTAQLAESKAELQQIDAAISLLEAGQ